LCLTVAGSCPMGSPGDDPSATESRRRRGEHPEARKHFWVWCIGARSRKVVR
jgi:hypothetical protein